MSEFKRVNIYILHDEFDCKGKLNGTQLQRINDDGVLFGEISSFSPDKKRRPMVDCCYSIEALTGDDGHVISARFGTLKILDLMPDREISRETQMLQITHKTQATAISQALKNSKSDHLILDCMKPLRRAYMKTNRIGQLAMEVRLLNYMRYGKDL